LPDGNVGMLERAMRIGYRRGMTADLVAIPSGSIAEAVASHPPRAMVMKRGRVVAGDGAKPRR
jgi:cytosine/creatinine deaminase